MASRIETPPRRRTFYPWHEWTDGSIWRAVAGEDFTVTVGNFQSALHIRAAQYGFKVTSASPEKGVVEFQFVKLETRQTPEV